MTSLLTYQIDSFTHEKFKGNPAGVVLNADGLTDGKMQAIARELNNSETAFLIKSDGDDCDGIIRYFTPKTEVPVCGHATIAALYALAHEQKLSSCILRMKTRVGVLPIEIIKTATDYEIVMTQGKFELGPVFDTAITQKLLEALGLDKDETEPRCPVQIASTGHSKVMIGIKSRTKLNNLTPDFQALAQLSKLIGCNGYFVFTFDTNNREILTSGRMFAPAIGINEDPVTGNANGPLGGYLVKNHLVEFGNNYEFTGFQGEAINRPGSMVVMVDIKNGEPETIRIKGNAVIVFKTEITL